MNSLIKPLISLAALVLMAQPSVAVLLVYEGFENYTAGVSMNGAATAGTGLTGNWGKSGGADALFAQNTSAMSYSSGNIGIDGGTTYAQMKGTSNYYYLALSSTLSNNNNYYFSFLMRSTLITGANEHGTLQLAPGTASSAERISAGVTGNGTNSYVFSRDTTGGAGTAVTSETTGTTAGQTLTAGTTYFMTGKLVSDGAKFTEMYLWVNPNDSASEGAGALWTSANILNTNDYNSDITHLGFRNFNMAGTDTFEVDEVRIGQTWSDVTVAIPEPATMALVLGGMAVAGCAARRRRV